MDRFLENAPRYIITAANKGYVNKNRCDVPLLQSGLAYQSGDSQYDTDEFKEIMEHVRVEDENRFVGNFEVNGGVQASYNKALLISATEQYGDMPQIWKNNMSSTPPPLRDPNETIRREGVVYDGAHNPKGKCVGIPEIISHVTGRLEQKIDDDVDEKDMGIYMCIYISDIYILLRRICYF